MMVPRILAVVLCLALSGCGLAWLPVYFHYVKCGDEACHCDGEACTDEDLEK